MKGEINLLPPLALKNRGNAVYLKHTGHLLRLLIGLFGMFLVVVLVSWGIWLWIAKDVNEQLKFLQQPSQAAVEEIERVNQSLAAVVTWRRRQSPWASDVAQWIRFLPSGMKIESIEVDDKESTMTLNGTFTNRESVIDYQERLLTMESISSVESPLSNFATGSSAVFSFVISRDEK